MPQGDPEAKEQDQGDETALVPKTLCPGMSVGDTGRFKVVASHEQEYAIEYIGKHGDKSESKSAEPAPEGESDYD